MTPVKTDGDDASAAVAELSTDGVSKGEDVTNRHVLRQAQLARELQQLNEMLADKQQLAGQMMRSDEQLEAVKLQYEVPVSFDLYTAICTLYEVFVLSPCVYCK